MHASYELWHFPVFDLPALAVCSEYISKPMLQVVGWACARASVGNVAMDITPSVAATNAKGLGMIISSSKQQHRRPVMT
jgi:hypothetical protein